MTIWTLSPGAVVAHRFQIDESAGSGGMGTVFRARDLYTGQIVALKVLNLGASQVAEPQRFAQEAALLAELHHPGIVSYVAHGHTPLGQPFLAMEWLEGEDLATLLLRGPLSVAESLLLLRSIAAALVVAHQHSVVHRDLKPSNLFLRNGLLSRVTLIDFGIARRIWGSHSMTRTGVVIGTPDYMAPEQARGEREITPRTDIFALGCVLYECLTGHPPFAAEHLVASLGKILFEDPKPVSVVRPGVPMAIDALLARMLAKSPDMRSSAWIN